MPAPKKKKLKRIKKPVHRKAKKRSLPVYQLTSWMQILRKNFKENPLLYLLLLTATGTFLVFGYYHIGKFFITDEIVWLRQRFPMYWHSVLNNDWSDFDTFNATSGILQSILSGRVYFTYDLSSLDYQTFEDCMVHWRRPLLIFNFILLFFIYERTTKLIDMRTGLLMVVILGLIPFVVGISQIFNKDTTLWSTSILAVLNYFLFLKHRKYRFALYAGIFLGLALLSKFPASILYPCFFLFIYLDYLTQEASKREFKRLLMGYLITVAVSMLVVFLLLPACWHDLKYLLRFTWFAPVIWRFTWDILIVIAVLITEAVILKGILSKYLIQKIPFQAFIHRVLPVIAIICLLFIAILIVTGTYNHIGFLNVEYGRNQATIRVLQRFLSSFRAIATGISTIGFVGFAGMMVVMGRQKTRKDLPRWYGYSLCVVLIYFLGSALSRIGLGVRYQMLLLPLYAFLAAGFYGSVIKKKYFLWVGVFLIISVVELAITAPFYISYSNPLSGKEYFKTGVNWGQGGYEIAEIANQLPNAGNVKIFSDYEGSCEFFQGQCIRYNFRYPITQELLQQYDYLSLSTSGYHQITKFIEMPEFLESYYNSPKNQAVAFIGSDQNYVKLVKVRK